MPKKLSAAAPVKDAAGHDGEDAMSQLVIPLDDPVIRYAYPIPPGLL